MKFTGTNPLHTQSSGQNHSHNNNPASGSPQHMAPLTADASVSNKSLYTYTFNSKILSPDIYEALEGNGELDNSKIQDVIHHVISELRALHGNCQVHTENLRLAAAQLAAKYPIAFQDRKENGEPHGDGYSTTLRKLQHRNNYMARKNNRKNNLEIELNIKRPNLSKFKHSDRVQVGCKFWQPTELPLGETPQSLEEKRVYLLNYAESMDDPEFLANLVNYVSLTFCYQRTYLNDLDEPRSISEIKLVWPVLTDFCIIMNHYETLVDIVSVNELFENLRNSISLILSYAQIKGLTAINSNACNYLKFYECVCFLCKHFKEDINNIFKNFPVSKCLSVYIFIIKCKYLK